MIDDPTLVILKSNHHQLPADVAGKLYFCVVSTPNLHYLELMRVDTLCRVCSKFILTIGDGICHIGKYHSTKIKCLEFIRDRYPDHFEWLLWHPEWL